MSQEKKYVSMIAATILLLAALACNFTPRQQGQDFPTPSAFATENPYLEVPRVELEKAKAAFDSGAAVFVDTRRGVSESDSHIPGALFISIDEIESRMDELDKNQWIITYCT